MDTYHLLRDNRESGPYTAKELKAKGLFSTDLLWIEGESTSWKTPAEFPELADDIREPEILPKETIKKAEIPATTGGTNSDYSPITVSTIRQQPLPVEELSYTPSFEELKKKYSERAPRKKVIKHQLNIGTNLIGLVTFVLGVSMAAFMVKKAIDNIEWEPAEIATAEAHEITSEKLPHSTTSHAAMTTVPLAMVKASTLTQDTAKAQPLVRAEQKKNTVKAHTVLPAAGEKTATPDTGAAKPITDGSDNSTDVAEASVPEEKTEKAPPKPELQLGANKYNVGVFGGISNLELSVTNASSQAVDKAIVEVEYIKSNGKVISSKTVEITGIAPGTTKKIAVPDNGRGVRVRYRVLDM